MTLKKPFLQLNRMMIFKDGKAVYNESYHEGVNIIRGQNSSGKTTIADFIYYSLSGEGVRWRTEAKECNYVISEYKVNDIFITIRRNITTKTQNSLSLFLGKIEDALATPYNWLEYPYRKSDGKDSFSEVFFRFLEVPDIKDDRDESITFHQLLRFLYEDQNTPPENILRTEQFDTGLKRETIASLLMGLNDDDYYKLNLQITKLKKKIELLDSQITLITKMMNESKIEFKDSMLLKKEIDSLKAQRNAKHKELNELDFSDKDMSIIAYSDISKNKKHLSEMRVNLLKLERAKESLLFEINDSTLFLKEINARIESVEEAIATKNELDGIVPVVCPVCLKKLQTSDINKCCLCGADKDSESYDESNLKRMQQELYLQKRESEILLKKRNESFDKIKLEYESLLQTMKTNEKWFDSNVSEIKSKGDFRRDNIVREIASFDAKIESLSNLTNMIVTRERLIDEKTEAKDEINAIQSRISKIQDNAPDRRSRVLDFIEGKIKYLLKKDNREEHFSNPKEIIVDFRKGIIFVDGKNQFSSSSMVYLKNCFNFAFLWAATEFDFMKHPRFLVLDNIEDKGMEESRSQNFQKIIVEESSRFPSKYQIIFTTSMIYQEFNKNPYVVGKFYTKDNKSLKI